MDAEDHIVLAPEMTAHGVTYPDMREVLLREGAKLKPGDVIDPHDMLGKTGYFTRIGGWRSAIEGYKQALGEIEKGDGRSVFQSKEEHLAHYQKMLGENEEELAGLLQAKNQAQKKKGI